MHDVYQKKLNLQYIKLLIHFVCVFLDLPVSNSNKESVIVTIAGLNQNLIVRAILPIPEHHLKNENDFTEVITGKANIDHVHRNVIAEQREASTESNSESNKSSKSKKSKSSRNLRFHLEKGGKKTQSNADVENGEKNEQNNNSRSRGGSNKEDKGESSEGHSSSEEAQSHFLKTAKATYRKRIMFVLDLYNYCGKHTEITLNRAYLLDP